MKHVGRGGIAEMPQQDSHKQHERDSQRNAKNFILPRYIPTKITNEYNSIVLASETLPGLSKSMSQSIEKAIITILMYHPICSPYNFLHGRKLNLPPVYISHTSFR